MKQSEATSPSKPAILAAMEQAKPLADKIGKLLVGEIPVDAMLALLMNLVTLKTADDAPASAEFMVRALHDTIDMRDAFIKHQQENGL